MSRWLQVARPALRDPHKLWYVRVHKAKTEEEVVQETLQRLEQRAAVLKTGLVMPDIPEDLKDLIRFALEELDIFKHVFAERSGPQYVSVRKEILAQMNDCLRRIEDMEIM